ncbi:MAG: xanthine dehydrogenase molybdopterin binding subunit [Hyphomicrobiales bacterium]|nr:MAG: xanthine dehydrogenase molybdopterin binding subunit [Hyphomicrobiales bacterium]
MSETGITKAPSVPEKIVGGVAEAMLHDSAVKHVTGQAIYIDDIPVPAGSLHLVTGEAEIARGRVVSMDLDAVRAAPGVVLVLTAADIPGHNDVSPTHSDDDPVLSEGEITFHGQPLFAVAATSEAAARAATKLARITVEEESPVITIADARKAGEKVSPDYAFGTGDVDAALAAAPRRLSGSMEIGGQEHFYLEGHISLVVPMEDGDVVVHCSTQHPSEVQHNVANVLGRPASAVTVEVRRMGGGFGGKESQATQWAALAAIAAIRTGKPVKCRLDRDDDMRLTGKRHDFVADWEVGFDDSGRILALDAMLAARCGVSKDLSDAIVDRAMFHIDNTYHLPASRIRTERLRTNTVSATAFRGFGGPQGMLVGERIVEAVARACGLDPLDVRQKNFYGAGTGAETPYGQKVEDFVADQLVTELAESARYRERRAEIERFNASSPVLKRGIALTPIKFGISFTTSFLNQAGALVHVYRDGSIMLNHGGTEMGQGLFMKVAQVVANVFQVDVGTVKITATSTAKVPNTSATAASSGSDLNGMAAFNAATAIRERLVAFLAETYKVGADDIESLPNHVRVGNTVKTFAEAVNEAYLGRIHLSSAGYYRTPKIGFDRASGKGHPFYYFAYGAALSEVAIDTLTGESRVLAVDILHDVGASLNPALDIGQIEGGFIQGMGWLTAEELWWDDKGRLRTHAPSTYKVPTCGDRPEHLSVRLWEKGRNVEPTIYRSKAVGEPPLMLAISVHAAITDALASLAPDGELPALDAPATPERILMMAEKLKANAG